MKIKNKHMKTIHLTTRLTLMIGCLFFLFSIAVTLMFYTVYRDSMLRHSSSSMQRDIYNIAKSLGEDLSMNSKDDFRKSLMGESTGYNLLLFERLTNGDIWVLDESHNIYTHQNDSLNMIPQGRLPAFVESVAAHTFLGENPCLSGKIDGENILVSGAPILRSDGSIAGVAILSVSYEALLADLNRGVRILVVSLVIALCIFLVATMIYSRSFVKPIRIIEASADALARGDYTVKTAVSRSDEIGDLANSMDILAERLWQAKQESERAELEKKNFLSQISHELKTPVTVIRGYLEAMEDGFSGTKQDMELYHGQILAESIWLQKLITSLFDLTRLQTIDYEINMQEVNLCELLGDVLMSARMLAQPKEIGIFCEQPKTEVKVRGDYDRLRQMLMILIDNAVKYTEQGGKIELGLQTDQSRLFVRDNGCGMSEEQITHVFEPYYRVQNRNHESTGLGLAIALEIAKKHQFSISIESKPGSGSTFYLEYGKVL